MPLFPASPQYHELMNNDWQVFRKNRVELDSGGFTTTTVLITTIKGRLSTVGGSRTIERDIGGKLENEVSHRFFGLVGANLQRDDVLVQVSGGTRKVRVINVVEPSEGEHHLEAECEELIKFTIPTV